MECVTLKRSTLVGCLINRKYYTNQKNMSGTNTLAYISLMLVHKKKGTLTLRIMALFITKTSSSTKLSLTTLSLTIKNCDTQHIDTRCLLTQFKSIMQSVTIMIVVVPSVVVPIFLKLTDRATVYERQVAVS
jgi:hypothetical protein